MHHVIGLRVHVNQSVKANIDRTQVAYVDGRSGDLQRQHLAQHELRLTVTF